MIATEEQYKRHKQNMAARMRASVAANAEIGPWPKRMQDPIPAIVWGEETSVVPCELWNACRYDLLKFLQTCFPNSTSLKPFSEEQLTAIRNLQDTILNGGSIVQALPRGFAKTTITERAAMWAVLYGHRRYVVVYAANKTLADGVIDSIKTELETNDLLAEMFPETCHAIFALEGRANRCKSQTYEGALTHIGWKADHLIMPTLPDVVSSGSIIEAKAVNAARGSKKTSPATGEVLRPDLILVDDPQTDEDAENPRTVDKICSRLNRSAFMGGGHSRAAAVVMSVTVIEEDDVAERYLNDPNWVAIRYKMLRSMPDRLDDLWLGQYAEIRRTFDKTSADSKQAAIQKALEFYIANREEMDRGAEATWEWCYNWAEEKSGEISAIQHAMNILIDRGADVFLHECQNQAIVDDEKDRRLHWKEILSKIISLPEDICPTGTTLITGHVDIGETLLNYTLWAWDDNGGGHVIRHKTYPEQTKQQFAFRKAPKSISDVAPNAADVQGAIYAALEAITNNVFTSDFTDIEGNPIAVEGLGIDIGYSGVTVMKFIEASPYKPLLFPMRGKGVGPRMKRISEWKRPKGSGQRAEDEWIYSRPDKRAEKVLLYDTNYYKSRHAEGWKAPLGNRVGFTLYKGADMHHKQFAQQSAVEKPVTEMYDGREVEVWELPISKPDNHFLDNNVGAFVLGHFKGIRRASDQQPRRKKKRRRVL